MTQVHSLSNVCSPSIEDISPVIQFVSHCCTINLHTSREHNQVVPLRNDVEEKVDVRPFVNEESDRMSIDDNRNLRKSERTVKRASRRS